MLRSCVQCLRERAHGLPRLFWDRSQGTGYAWARVLTATVLLVAASLKAYELVAGPGLSGGLLSTPLVATLVVEYELLLAILLLSTSAALTWRVAIFTFTAFAGVSLLRALAGETTCGCFGRLIVPPWRTFFLDLGIVGMLAVCRPGSTGAFRRPGVRVMLSHLVKGVRQRWIAAGFGLAVLGVPVVLAVVGQSNRAASDGLQTALGGRVVVMDPGKWIGRRLPLLDYVEGSAPLERDQWAVLLYNPRCTVCRTWLGEYRRAASMSAADIRDHSRRLAIVELPPYAGGGEAVGEPPFPRCLWIRLRDDREWVTARPSLIDLDQGVVVAIREPVAGVSLNAASDQQGRLRGKRGVM